MISVIVPAHNEESVIERCLTALLDGVQPGELEIIVVCNGCSDGTAEKARAFGGPVTVLELDQASKTAALNAGDAAARGFPRMYVDADVVFPLESIRKVAEALAEDGAMLASPVADSELRMSSAPVRAFYDVWLRLPYNRVMVGTGVYALSESGRARFGEFPDIIADDGYVRSRFTPDERVAVEDAPVTVYAPRTFGDLVRVKTRSRVGGYQVAERFPSPETPDKKSVIAMIRSLPWGIGLPWKVMVYLWVNLVVRIRAHARLRSESSMVWDRDSSARAGAK